MLNNMSLVGMQVGDWGLVTTQNFRKLVKITHVTPSFVSVNDTKYRVKDGLEWGDGAASRRYLYRLTTEELKTIRAEIHREKLINSVRLQCDVYSLKKMTTDKLEQLNAILGNM